jgi:hypothetical protein
MLQVDHVDPDAQVGQHVRRRQFVAGPDRRQPGHQQPKAIQQQPRQRPPLMRFTVARDCRHIPPIGSQ